MRIAIVGSGMAGLSVCWYLLSLGQEVTLFDSEGVQGGASWASTGLMHPFPGRSAGRSWGASSGMKETEELLKIAEHALGKTVAKRNGIFRPAVTNAQKKDFFFRAQEDSDAIWQKHPLFGEGIWIPKGVTVHSQLYLKGLAKACEKAHFSQEKILCLEQLDSYDRVVLAAGAQTVQFEECKHLPLKATKGQSLVCRWETALDFSLVSQGHITPTEDPDLCQVGSTYERSFSDSLPQELKAFELKEKVALFYPPASDFKVIEIRSGIRISPINGYLPIVKKLNDKSWVFTGLGSRGLLYHAFLGKALAEAIVLGKTEMDIGLE